MRKQKYDAWTAPFRRNPSLRALLVNGNKALTALGYVAFPLLLVLQAAFGDWGAALRTVLTAGVSFVVLSVFRKIVNAHRPYETLDIDPLIQKDTEGKSFPSRHTFSMFMIAFCWLAWCLPVGVFLTITGVLIAIARVLGGVHWPRDVIAAFVFAAVAALIGFVAIP